MHVSINFVTKKNKTIKLYYIEQYNLGNENVKYKMFQMIIRKFTVAIILLNLSKYFSKNHGFGYRSLAHQDGSKSKVSSISVIIIFYIHFFIRKL